MQRAKAACTGLRASEIAQLQVGDVRVELVRPHLRIRRGAAKVGRPRTVPLWWDRGTLEDLLRWKQERQAKGTKPFLLLVSFFRVRAVGVLRCSCCCPNWPLGFATSVKNVPFYLRIDDLVSVQ